MNSSRPLALVCVCLCLVVLGRAAPACSQPTTQAEHVKELLLQLENANEQQKLAAEWDLLKLGPDILPLLPISDKSSDALKKRLDPIRLTLEELLPRKLKATGKAEELALSEALKRVQTETGLALVDRRQGGYDQRVLLDGSGGTFWQAVQSLASQAKASISLYQGDSKVALVDAPYRALPVSFYGPFRVAIKRLRSTADLDAGTHTCAIDLELAWEPRFLPLLLEVGPAALHAGKDAAGQPFAAQLPSRGAVDVKGTLAQEFDLRFPAPLRSTAKIDELKGEFVVTLPVKMLKFVFKDLQRSDKPGTSKTQDGVEVTINKVETLKDRWMVEIAIENPKAGPRLESHQTYWWLRNNTLHLERGAGQTLEVLEPEKLLEQTSNVTASRATIRYFFLTKNAQGVPLEGWRLVCRTPGRLVEVRVPYTFKDVALP